MKKKKAAPKKKKKVVKKKAKKKAVKKKKAAPKKKKKKSSRKPNPAFVKPFAASAALEKVVGSKSISRPQATKKIWEYIKRHKLQDPKNRRNINLDDKLKGVFGNKRQINMLEIPKALGKNLK